MLLSENDLPESQEEEIKTTTLNLDSKAQSNLTKRRIHWNTQAFLYTIMSKEFLCLVITLVSYYAMFVTSLTKTNKVSPAQLFFTNSSCVFDHYEGNLGSAMRQAFTSDISVILLYAPWDADSQLARQEFDMTCRFFSKQIKFLAINCWHPGSTCHSHFSKLSRYPAILVYIQSEPATQAIQYKGLQQADHMISFLHHVLRPIHRIDSVDHLTRYKANNDGLIVLCSDITTERGSRLYKVFYRVSLKFLEYDALREVKFAAVLNSQVPLYFTQTFPSLVLVNFNNSVNYKGNFTEEQIIEWILNSLGSKPISWINLSGTKSLTLNYYLRNETSLVLFTPRNLLRNINIYYNILKIIAADFHKNCGGSGSSSTSPELADKYQILINYLVVNNIIELANHKILSETCDQLKMKIIEKIIAKRKQLEVNREELLGLTTKSFANETVEKRSSGANFGGYVLNMNKDTGALFPLIGGNTDIGGSTVEFLNASSPVTSSTFVPSRPEETRARTDKYSIMNLLYENSKQMCKLLRLANRILGMPSLSEVDAAVTSTDESKTCSTGAESKVNAGNNGQSFADCATNKSLNFLSIDSKRYRYFLDNLNIDVRDYRDETLAIIVDVVNDNENIYLLEANITRERLVVFVRDYLDDKLTRYQRSNDFVDALSFDGGNSSDTANIEEETHDGFHGNEAFHSSKSQHPATQRAVNRPVVSLNRQFDALPRFSRLRELTTSTFDALANSTATNIVFFYSKYCGLCPAYSHTLYLFAHVLSHVREIGFYRVDSDTNDLAYRFVPQSLPTLIIFPSQDADNSRVFPRTQSFTRGNLLAFLLRSVSSLPLRTHVYLSVCLKTDARALSCLQGVNRMLHAYLLKCRLKLASAYGITSLNAYGKTTTMFSTVGTYGKSPSLVYNMKIKKYLVRMKYFRFVQLYVRNHILASRPGRRKINSVVSYLYRVYQKCERQISHINCVYERLVRKTPAALSRQYRVKEEL